MTNTSLRDWVYGDPFNTYDDYQIVRAFYEKALEEKLEELAVEGWEPFRQLECLDLGPRLLYQQHIIKRMPFPGSLPRN